MGANGDASTMVISSVHDARGVRHVEAPDMTRRAMWALGSSFPLFGTQVPCQRTARRRAPIATRNLNTPDGCHI
jgi:hypothetical protein